MKKVIVLLSFIGVLLISAQSFSQTTDSTKCKVESYANVGLASQYVWRGVMMDNKPNIQPTLGLKYKGFELGTWASVSALNSFYEIDLYASYTYKFVKVSVTDYYYDYSGTANNQSFFNCSDTAGYHHVLCDLAIGGTEKIPIKFTASTAVYSGWDLDSACDKRYTTYLELRCYHKNWELYAGAITGESYFYLNDTKGFNAINVGAVYNYKIKDIPTTIQLCMNPRMEKIYLTFGIVF